MNVQTSHNNAYPSMAGMMPMELSSLEGVVLRHLKSRSEIETVLHLREEIDLSVHSSASSNFFSLEKKETKWVSSALSNSMESS